VARLQEETAEGKVDIASLREDLDMIAESAAQITEVKEQLIGAVREVRPRPVLLEDVLQTAVHARALDAGLLHVEIDPEAAYVIADSTQLTRALGNILQNAAEAGAKSVKVSAHPIEEQGLLEITIEDDGIGMSEGVQRKAWSPFFSTRGGEHHGLGLPAAMHVVSQAQGRVADEISSKGNVSSVALVDDDDAWAKQFAETLAQMNVKLTRVTDLSKIPAADLILVDEHCTSLRADDVLAAVTKGHLLAKTVILTTAINPERVADFLRAGVRDVQLKPYTHEEVAELVS